MLHAAKFAMLALAILAAGCAEGSGATQQGASQSTTLAPTQETGSIDVLVTTPELAPVAGAQVQLAGTPLSGVTDEGGRYVFSGLEPTSYTVVVAKPGHKALQPKGRVVTVVAGESVETKLTLEPAVVVSARNAYERTFIFRGFISCSIERVTVSPVFNRTQCGNGVDVAGTRVGRDPNDNFAHTWTVESRQIQSIVLETDWAPSFSALGDQLYVTAQDAFTCSAQSCNYANEIGGKGGKSPLRHVIQEGGDEKITKALERHPPEGYPKTAWTVARTYCPAPCTIAVSFQQSYQQMTSVFYGAPAPDGFTAKP